MAMLVPGSTIGVQVYGVIVNLGENMDPVFGKSIPLKNNTIKMIAAPDSSGVRRLKL